MKRISLLLASLFFVSSSWAQSAPVEEGNSFAPPPPSMMPSVAGDMPPQDGPVTAAQLELRLSNMEDELRSLRGKNEELNFQIKKLTDNMDKMQRDVEMRLGDMEGRKPLAGNESAKPEMKLGETSPSTVPALEDSFPKTPQGTSGGDGVLKLPDPGAEATPRDLYNHAFRLLNQTKYSEAAAAFDSFTKKYPKDPLIGNAYYWQGETYYIRRDYVTAADNFRAGFEALPSGPKAADNLLKLSMSLSALSRDKEACVVLSQVVTKFKKDSVSVTEKAQAEQKRLGCK